MWRSRCEMGKPDQGPNCERGWWWRPLQQWQSWWQKYDLNARLGSTRVLHMDVPKAGKETMSFFAAYTPRAGCTQRSGSMSWPHAFWFGRCAVLQIAIGKGFHACLQVGIKITPTFALHVKPRPTPPQPHDGWRNVERPYLRRITSMFLPHPNPKHMTQHRTSWAEHICKVIIVEPIVKHNPNVTAPRHRMPTPMMYTSSCA